MLSPISMTPYLWNKQLHLLLQLLVFASFISNKLSFLHAFCSEISHPIFLLLSLAKIASNLPAILFQKKK